MSLLPPSAHAECTSSRHAWIGDAFERAPHWQECENRPWANEANRRATGCIGHDFVLHHPRVHLRFFWQADQQQLGGVVHFAHDTEGPPKGAHGASIALVFDEILAYPVWRVGLTAFTANLNINLRRMIPLGATLRFHAHIREQAGKKIHTAGAITSDDGRIVYADATGLWIESGYLSKIGDVRQTTEDGTNKRKAPEERIDQEKQHLTSKL